MWSLKIKKRTSGFFSASQSRTGWYPLKMGAHTGSSCFFWSKANPMVGVCELATAPIIFAIDQILYHCMILKTLSGGVGLSTHSTDREDERSQVAAQQTQ